ncbi:hypothetical protein EJB05_33706, partial [Eragrostis curvula]
MELSRLWQVACFLEWPGEGLVKLALQSLAIMFRFMSVALSDPCCYASTRKLACRPAGGARSVGEGNRQNRVQNRFGLPRRESTQSTLLLPLSFPRLLPLGGGELHCPQEAKQGGGAATQASPIRSALEARGSLLGVARAEKRQRLETEMVTVEDTDPFDCDVCCHPLKPPIFECDNGHPLCSSCRDKLAPVGKCHFLFLLNVDLLPLGCAISVHCIRPHHTIDSQGLPSKAIKCLLSYSRWFDEPMFHHNLNSDLRVDFTDLSEGLPNQEMCFKFVIPKSALEDGVLESILVDITRGAHPYRLLAATNPIDVKKPSKQEVRRPKNPHPLSSRRPEDEGHFVGF